MTLVSVMLQRQYSRLIEVSCEHPFAISMILASVIFQQQVRFIEDSCEHPLIYAMYAIRYAMYSELDAMLMLAMLCYAVCYVCVCEPKKISFIYYFF
jgi:hypothetical protein